MLGGREYTGLGRIDAGREGVYGVGEDRCWVGG